MTRKANARLAGFMFLFYIATAVSGMLVTGRAMAGNGAAAQLASIAQHVPELRAGIVLSLITIFDALVLAVALYGLTRDYDPDLAMLALSCGIAEVVVHGVNTLGVRALLWVSTAASAVTADALGPVLLKTLGWSEIVGSTVFVVGGAVYGWLLTNGVRQEAANA